MNVMLSRRILCSGFVSTLCLILVSAHALLGQDDSAKRGRKYKAPPPTSHIEVLVTKKFNGKPIMNAAVVFDSTMDGKDEGNLEVKTGPDGKAAIDVIPTGSTVRVQVIATGYATYAEEYKIDGPSRNIAVAMIHPQAQISSYEDNDGKSSTLKPGVQEPVRPKPVPPATPATSTTPPAQDNGNSTTAPKQ